MIKYEDDRPSLSPKSLDLRVRKALSSGKLTSEQKEELSYLYGISLLYQAIIVRLLDDTGA